MQMEKVGKVVLSLGMILSLLAAYNVKNNIKAEESDANTIEENKNGPQQNRYYTIIDENGQVIVEEYESEDDEPKTLESNDYKVVKTRGNETYDVKTYDTYEEAKKNVDKLKMYRSPGEYDIEAIADTKDIQYGVARIVGYVKYKEYDGTGKGRSGYTHGTSANDAAYISTSSDGKTVRVKQAGVYMDIPASSVKVSEYTSNSQVSYYYGKDGNFYHYYYTGTYGKKANLAMTRVGYTPSYLKNQTKYYSYDGHYFYSDYISMLKDYQTGVNYHNRAINASQPYYNYYQYLSFRATTHFSAANFNQLIDNAIKNYDSVDDTTKLKNQGQALLNAQTKNGINASLMLGVTINESAWGMSYYAKDRNNLFGIGAVDSDPDKAIRFDSVEECFKYFSYNTISSGYLNGMDWRYRGPHLGDKLSGINVQYASDPYWGEKAASFSYTLNDNNSNKDYQKYDIAISKKGELDFYKDEATKTKIYESTSTVNYYVYEVPATIIGTSSNSYKVLSDTVLNAKRTGQNAKGYFDIDRDYVYIKKADVNLRGAIHSNSPDPTPTYKKGDVNMDGKITTSDLLKLEKSIVYPNTNKLNNTQIVLADVNNDGKVDSRDLLKLEKHLLYGTAL